MPVENGSCLITSDLHLVDTPTEEYRWKIFDVLVEEACKYDVTDIFIIGDVWDRKDRHTATLLHRSIFALMALQERTDAQVWVTAGNHDKPVNGPYYWKILNYIKTEDSLGSYLRYVTKPTVYHNICLLPFAPNPIEDWKEFFKGNSGFKAIFMHQTGQGVTVENDRLLVSNNLPSFPEGIPVYSGDVHRPQFANGITYVGTPYPIRFSESWGHRIILIKESDFKNPISIKVDIMHREIVNITSVEELKNRFKTNDQIRVRCKLTGNKLADWPVEEEKIRAYCKEKGIVLASIEGTFEGGGLSTEQKNNSQIEFMKPEEIIKMFCENEKLSDEIINIGLELVKESA